MLTLYRKVELPVDIVIITGIGNSGKTTAGSLLSETFSIPCFSLDLYSSMLDRDELVYLHNLEKRLTEIIYSCWYCNYIIEGAHFIQQSSMNKLIETFEVWRIHHPLGRIHVIEIKPPYNKWIEHVKPESENIRDREYYNRMETKRRHPAITTIVNNRDKLVQLVKDIYNNGQDN